MYCPSHVDYYGDRKSGPEWNFDGLLIGPLAATVAAAAIGRHRLVGRLGAGTAALGFLGAVVLLISSAGGHLAAMSVNIGQQPVVAVSADRLAAVLLVLVYGVSAIVQSFAIRYLAEDSRAGWFSAGAGLLTSASATLMTAQTLVVLAVGWTAAGVALCLLLGTYRQLPSARDGVRRTAKAFLIGDLALWSAFVDRGPSGHRRPTRPPGRTAGRTACRPGRLSGGRGRPVPFGPDAISPLAARHAGRTDSGVSTASCRRSQRRSHPAHQAQPVVTAAGVPRRSSSSPASLHLAYGAVIMLVKPDIKGRWRIRPWLRWAL